MGWGWYPKPRPRRPVNGIKAQSSRFGKTWWASKWLAALERLVDPARLGRGRSYARSGQVLNIDIKPGHIQSRVQGSQSDPYKVSIDIKPLSEKEWAWVADAMAGQAIFAAKLLAGEMPQNIEEAFGAAGVSLFPDKRDDLETDCSCPDWANPCKHVAAVYYLLGEQFDTDPFLIFRLRGKTKDRIMELLRARRAVSAPQGPASPRTPGRRKKGERGERERVIPLAKCLDHFWTAADPLDDFRIEIKGAEVDAAPVKRLGAPTFWHARGNFLGRFDRAYHDVTQDILDLVAGRQADLG
ncbi:MAG: SWIM zinc finger family protein [Anaerolineae bacterium]